MFFCRGQALEPTGCYSSLTPKLFRALSFVEAIISKNETTVYASTIERLQTCKENRENSCVNALSGLSCYEEMVTRIKKVAGFNALSGLYLISTKPLGLPAPYQKRRFQCPLGLIPHFYSTPSKT